MRHTFTYTPTTEANTRDHVRALIETDTENLDEVIEAMQAYLRAAGFVFEGQLDIVEEPGTD